MDGIVLEVAREDLRLQRKEEKRQKQLLRRRLCSKGKWVRLVRLRNGGLYILYESKFMHELYSSTWAFNTAFALGLYNVCFFAMK